MTAPECEHETWIWNWQMGRWYCPDCHETWWAEPNPITEAERLGPQERDEWGALPR